MKRTRSCLTTIVALIILIAIIAAVAGSSHHNKSGPTSSPALVTNHNAAKHKATIVAAKPQTFKGNGAQNIGTINVPTQSTLRWTCPTCAGDNFIIENSFNDANEIDVNAEGPTSGQTVVDSGTYHDVEVNTEGQAWTVRIVPGT